MKARCGSFLTLLLLLHLPEIVKLQRRSGQASICLAGNLMFGDWGSWVVSTSLFLTCLALVDRSSQQWGWAAMIATRRMQPC